MVIVSLVFCTWFHPLMRVWIEIEVGSAFGCGYETFHPLMRVWIEIWVPFSVLRDLAVSPSYEGVD